ncbi:MAG: hypothetical protein AAGE88_22990, partial [Actinomycetota bacterium]
MFAAEAAETAVPWLYENVWLIPALPATSFLLILFFGKRLPFKGAEIGITSVVAAFVLAVLTTFTWVGDVEGGNTAYGTVKVADEKHSDEEHGDDHSHSEDEDHGSSEEEHDDEEHDDEGALLVDGDGGDAQPIALTAGALAAVEEGDYEPRGAAVVTEVNWFESGLNVFRIGTLV